MSPPPDRPTVRPTGPPPKDEGLEPTPKPPATRETTPPTPKQTMEVEAAWLDTQLNGREQEGPPSYNGATEEALRAARLRKPPRVPGAMHTLPPMPMTRPMHSRPPPPLPSKRHETQEVELSEIEILDEDLTEEDVLGPGEATAGVPNLDDGSDGPPEITRVAPPSSAQLEGPPEPPSEAELDTRTLEVAVPAIVQVEAVHSDIPPPAAETGPRVAAPSAAETVQVLLTDTAEVEAVQAEAVLAAERATAMHVDAERQREEALAARQRDSDARDREMRLRRKAEREQERIEEQARAARREQEKKDAEARAAAEATIPRAPPVLDLSNIDDEIDFALDRMLGPNLSYPPPPPPSGDDKDKK